MKPVARSHSAHRRSMLGVKTRWSVCVKEVKITGILKGVSMTEAGKGESEGSPIHGCKSVMCKF